MFVARATGVNRQWTCTRYVLLWSLAVVPFRWWLVLAAWGTLLRSVRLCVGLSIWVGVGLVLLGV